MLVKGQFIDVKIDVMDEQNLWICMYIAQGVTDNLLSRATTTELISRINMMTCGMYEGTSLIKTESDRLKLKQNSNGHPYSVNFPWHVPIHLLLSVLEEIDWMENKDTITQMNEASE